MRLRKAIPSGLAVISDLCRDYVLSSAFIAASLFGAGYVALHFSPF
ncbi:MAG: hypothetical protein AAGA87_06315 [Pseudomonadota bacterium]